MTESKIEIPITCKGQRYVSFYELEDFQGELKNITTQSLERCRSSILKYGFSFPVFVWKNSILDGHQRLRVIKDLLSEGYSIGNIPVVEIEAENEREAAEKLLLLSSRYGEITDHGLFTFVEAYELDIESLKDELELPEIDFDDFLETFIRDIKPANIPDETEEIDDDTGDIIIKLEIGPLLWSEKADEILENVRDAVSPYKKKIKIRVQE